MKPFAYLKSLIHCPVCDSKLTISARICKCNDCGRELINTPTTCCKRSYQNLYRHCPTCKYEFKKPLIGLIHAEVNSCLQLLKIPHLYIATMQEVDNLLELEIVDIFTEEFKDIAYCTPYKRNHTCHCNNRVNLPSTINFKTGHVQHCCMRGTINNDITFNIMGINKLNSKQFSMILTCAIINMLHKQEDTSKVDDFLPGYVGAVKCYLLTKLADNLKIHMTTPMATYDDIKEVIQMIPTKKELDLNIKTYKKKIDDLELVVKRLHSRLDIIRNLHKLSISSIQELSTLSTIYTCESTIVTNTNKVEQCLTNSLQEIHDSIRKTETPIKMYKDLLDTNEHLLKICDWNTKLPVLRWHYDILIEQDPSYKSVESVKFIERKKYEDKLYKLEAEEKERCKKDKEKILSLTTQHKDILIENEILKSHHSLEILQLKKNADQDQKAAVTYAVLETEKRLLKHDNNQIEGMKSIDEF